MENFNPRQAQAEQGFTLIELSIVLVIIGLIVGGVLVGQDLIKAAEIRATVGQIEKYNTAVNTFRNKYGYIPGDLPQGATSTASALGFYSEDATLGGTAGHGDGNGLIEGGSAAAVVGIGEPLEFWRHLTDAQMIDGSFGNAGSSVIIVGTGRITTALVSGTVGGSFPPAKLGRGNYLHVYAVNGLNYYQIAGITAMTLAGVFTKVSQLTPIEAQNIDAKVDDGLATTGTVIARGGAANMNAAADANCVSSTAYDVGTSNGSVPNCQLQLRFN